MSKDVVRSSVRSFISVTALAMLTFSVSAPGAEALRPHLCRYYNVPYETLDGTDQAGRYGSWENASLSPARLERRVASDLQEQFDSNPNWPLFETYEALEMVGNVCAPGGRLLARRGDVLVTRAMRLRPNHYTYDVLLTCVAEPGYRYRGPYYLAACPTSERDYAGSVPPFWPQGKFQPITYRNVP